MTSVAGKSASSLPVISWTRTPVSSSASGSTRVPRQRLHDSAHRRLVERVELLVEERVRGIGGDETGAERRMHAEPRRVTRTRTGIRTKPVEQRVGPQPADRVRQRQ